MSKRDNLLLVDDIIDSLKAIINFTQNKTYNEFVDDRMRRDAVIRNFEIIGEAANYISPEFKLEHPEIEWRKMSDLRNRFIHTILELIMKLSDALFKMSLQTI